MQIALFGGAVELLAAWCARDRASARREGRKNGVEPPDHIRLAPDHHAVTSLQTPDTAAGSDVHVVDLFRRELFCAPYVIHVIGIAAVDEDVSRFEMGQEIGDSAVHDRCGHHQPHCSRLIELRREFLQPGTSDCFLPNQLVHCLRRHIEDDALAPSFQEAPHHVCAHASKSHHSKLHQVTP